MRGKRPLRLMGIGVVALGIAVAGAFGLRALGLGSAGAEDADAPAPSSQSVRVETVDGKTRIIVDRAALDASGIETKPAAATTYQPRTDALGSIENPQTLADTFRSYQSAQIDLDRAKVASNMAQTEVNRLGPLHRDNSIVSTKTLQSAQVAGATEQAGLKTALNKLQLQESAIRSQWGPVLAAWLTGGSPQLDRVLSGQSLLVQVALPAGQRVAVPKAVQLQASPGRLIEAAVISSVPQADPRFQGQGFFVTAPGDVALLPGMTVPVSVPNGDAVQGVVIPTSTVVRWQGQTYVYVVPAVGQFVRQAVTTDIMTPDGWLVRTGLPAGTPVVVSGAALLLSEEMKRDATAGAGP